MTAQNQSLKFLLLCQWMFTGEHVIHFWLMGHKSKYAIRFPGFLTDKKRYLQEIASFLFLPLDVILGRSYNGSCCSQHMTMRGNQILPNTLLLLSCWVHLPWNHLFLDFLFYELYRILYLSISLFTPQNILTYIQYQLPLDVPFKRLVFMQLVYEFIALLMAFCFHKSNVSCAYAWYFLKTFLCLYFYEVGNIISILLRPKERLTDQLHQGYTAGKW